jgi:hypothetical protein
MPEPPPGPWAGGPQALEYPPLGAYPPGVPLPPFAPPTRVERGGPAFAASRVGMRLARQVTREAYVLRVQVAEGQAAGVQVTPLAGPRGQGLAVSHESQTVREDSFDDGRGYGRGFSFSRGASSRRLSLPPDADLAGLTREDRGDTVIITIPRHRPVDPRAEPTPP